jgi:hypothetical protein
VLERRLSSIAERSSDGSRDSRSASSSTKGGVASSEGGEEAARDRLDFFLLAAGRETDGALFREVDEGRT